MNPVHRIRPSLAIVGRWVGSKGRPALLLRILGSALWDRNLTDVITLAVWMCLTQNRKYPSSLYPSLAFLLLLSPLFIYLLFLLFSLGFRGVLRCIWVFLTMISQLISCVLPLIFLKSIFELGYWFSEIQDLSFFRL